MGGKRKQKMGSGKKKENGCREGAGEPAGGVVAATLLVYFGAPPLARSTCCGSRSELCWTAVLVNSVG